MQLSHAVQDEAAGHLLAIWQGDQGRHKRDHPATTLPVLMLVPD